jgi:two-component system sensor histidine kinase/response regulator
MPHRDRILIVDDNPTNVVILEEMLDDKYQLATAASGEEALAIVSDFRPDLILLDLMMPGIDGYETCRRIRASPALCHTKIIMVSAKAMVEERLQGYEAGADDYVVKPFEVEELLAKVRVYLRLKTVEEVDQLKSDVLTLLGHETSTPLSTIITPVQLLLTEEDLSAAERTDLLHMVEQSATRLQHLFGQVLTLSKLKAGQCDFELLPVDLNDVVQSAVSIVAQQAAERNVRLEQELPEATITMLDLGQMLGVVTAILENAIRFSPAKGCVIVRVQRDASCCWMTVTDQGPGIEPQRLPYVFDEFPETDIDHHTVGMGLSLAIANRVVLAHNGTIEVESTQEAGTTFTVRIPVMAPTDDSHEALCRDGEG